MSTYTTHVIAAAKRVSAIFEFGGDRCDYHDLDLLHFHSLMTKRRCTESDAARLDSMEPGETLYEFNEEGDALVAAIRGEHTTGAG